MAKRLLRTSIYYLIDSKGHSRYVLRILIILSHQTRKQREPLLLFERVGSHGWRLSQPWAFSCFRAPRSTQTALDQPPKPTCNPVGARPRATRFVDSKGYSRFVLRILIVLSQPEPRTRARRIAVHVVGTVHRTHRKNRDVCATRDRLAVSSPLPQPWMLLTRRGRVDGRVARALPYDKQREGGS